MELFEKGFGGGGVFGVFEKGDGIADGGTIGGGDFVNDFYFFGDGGVGFENHADLLMDVAKEQNVEVTDEPAMSKVGVEIGKNLMKQKCGSFMQLAMKMGKDDDAEGTGAQVTTGVFKRIDTKGFNYIVITDKAAAEKSFIWLRQFSGSEKFIDASPAKLAGKKLQITWKDLEVYLPQAKGYYTVKEIVSIDIL